MGDSSHEPSSRFPWGYATAIMLPIGAILSIVVLDRFKGPDYSMTPAMALVCVIGPYYGAVLAWGAWRLGEGGWLKSFALLWSGTLTRP